MHKTCFTMEEKSSIGKIWDFYLKLKVEKLELLPKLNDIKIVGLKESNGDNTVNKVIKMLENNLDIEIEPRDREHSQWVGIKRQYWLWKCQTQLGWLC